MRARALVVLFELDWKGTDMQIKELFWYPIYEYHKNGSNRLIGSCGFSNETLCWAVAFKPEKWPTWKDKNGVPYSDSIQEMINKPASLKSLSKFAALSENVILKHANWTEMFNNRWLRDAVMLIEKATYELYFNKPIKFASGPIGKPMIKDIIFRHYIPELIADSVKDYVDQIKIKRRDNAHYHFQ